MSYLNSLRLVFSGDFQSDVSTVNNDVRHYDNATFEKQFQDFQQGNVYNGWWNPIGSSAFRLINCKVKSVFVDNEEIQDEALGLYIGGSNNRAGGKMVDLDPQFQMASGIWGLTIRLTDGKQDFLVGQFEPASFRDIMFGRRQGAGGSTGASACFQSVLTDLQWGDDLKGSPYLETLKAASTNNGKLSIRLTTFGYSTNKNADRFTLGTVIGAIGPYDDHEPNSFVRGRRMVPNLDNNGAPLNKINFFDGWVDEEESSVLVDLGNALPLTLELGLQDLGTLQLAVLKDANIKESEILSPDDGYVALGKMIPYQASDWLYQTAGIHAAPLLSEQLDLIQEHPLALIEILEDNTAKVLVRESIDGLFIRADDFVQRVEPTESAKIELYASRYGKPLPNTSVRINFSPPNNTAGGGPPNDPQPPKARIPWTDLPREALTNLPLTLTTDAAGKAKLSIETQDPGNPRGYIDGQIYTLQYSLEGQANSQKQLFDAIYLLLFDGYSIPEQPTWLEHIHPIFQQYGNLYPIMSQRLVDLGDYDSVRQHRAILDLSFSLDIHDSNSMPVTRDLSAVKRATILRWLREQYADGSYIMRLGKPKPTTEAPVVIQSELVQSLAREAQAGEDSTAHGYQNLQIALRQNQSDS